MKNQIKSIIIGTLFCAMATLVPGVDASAINYSRLSGSDRYGTSEAISSQFEKADVAILVTGENYPDALSATPLAAKYKSPIILTGTKKLDSNAESEIKRLGAKNLIIVGGESAINSEVEGKVKDLGVNVERISGKDRYSTAVEVAKKIGTGNGIFVTTGLNYADALSVGPVAGKLQMPILLVGKDEISQDVNDIISSDKPRNTYVIGGNNAVSTKVAEKFSGFKRISGEDRYSTNGNLINTFKDDLNFTNAYVATGNNFPDALSGGALAALNGNPIVLIGSNVTEGSTRIIKDNSIGTLTFLGGETVISNEVASKLSGKVENSSIVDENSPMWTAGINGKFYHDSPECSNMKTPFKITLKIAREKGIKPCIKCNPAR